MYKKMNVEVYVEPAYAQDVKEAMLKAAFFKMNSIHEELSRHHMMSECVGCAHIYEDYYGCGTCAVLGNGSAAHFEFADETVENTDEA